MENFFVDGNHCQMILERLFSQRSCGINCDASLQAKNGEIIYYHSMVLEGKNSIVWILTFNYHAVGLDSWVETAIQSISRDFRWFFVWLVPGTHRYQNIFSGWYPVLIGTHNFFRLVSSTHWYPQFFIWNFLGTSYPAVQKIFKFWWKRPVPRYPGVPGYRSCRPLINQENSLAQELFLFQRPIFINKR